MSPTQATVLGGTGFLGSTIVQALLSRGWRVRIGARHPERARIAADTGPVTGMRCDVRDEASLVRAMQGSAAVVNAVGLYRESGGERFDSVHVQGAARAAHSAARAGIERFVHVSGIGASRASASSYVRARAEGECAVREVFPTAMVVRPSVLFGPGDGFLGAIDALSKRSPVFPLFGRGDTRMQPVYVGDVAAAVASLLDDPAVHPCIVELGGKRVLTYRRIVEAVLGFRGRRRLLLPVPFGVWMLQAKLLAPLQNAPPSEHQVILMRSDNVVGDGMAGLADLGIAPGDLEALLPTALGAGAATAC